MAGGLQKVRMPGSLKEAIADLVVACGGQSACAEKVRVSRTQIARYTDDADRDAFMPVDIVQQLESMCCEPIVTRYLASAQHCALMDAGDTGDGETCPVTLSKIGRETGELFAESAAALADGTISVSEAGRMRREALDVMTQSAALVADLDRGRC